MSVVPTSSSIASSAAAPWAGLKRVRTLATCSRTRDSMLARSSVAFGFFLFGSGQVWADDFKLERVSESTPVTGKRQDRPPRPANLDFEG